MNKLIESVTCIGLAILLLLSVFGLGWLVFAALDTVHAALGAL